MWDNIPREISSHIFYSKLWKGINRTTRWEQFQWLCSAVICTGHFRENRSFGSLCSKRSFFSRSVKMIDGSPCCLHQVTTVQPSRSSPLNRPQDVRYGKPLKKTLAPILVVKRCGKFIITGKLVLYFKTSGKVKSKWPIGGWLWILLETIWLKIKVIVCIIIVVRNI